MRHCLERTSMTRTRALTLLEILVVVAIIALIASLAYPAYVSAKESAKRSRSMSNMRQLSLALNLYCENEPGEGPNRLGLPHQPGNWFGDLPSELKVTGGTRDPAGVLVARAAYTMLIPTWNDDGTPGYNGDHLNWPEHVALSSMNPVWLLDVTYPVNVGVMKPRRHMGVALDGSVRTKWRSGIFTDALEHWR